MSERVFIIGMGEVGRRLGDTLVAAGAAVVPVTRAAGWERAAGAEPGVRLVCVGEDGLAAVMGRLAAVPTERLVFVQNGWLRPLLDARPGHTRALIWFTSKASFFHELRPSVLHGPTAAPLAASLRSGGLNCHVTGDTEFREREAEKMGFNCVVGLPLVVRGLSLGEYLAAHRREAWTVFTEAVEVTARALGVRARSSWWPRFLAVAKPLAWVRPSAAKALEFRNGAVVDLAAAMSLDAAANRALLDAVAARSRP